MTLISYLRVLYLEPIDDTATEGLHFASVLIEVVHIESYFMYINIVLS